MYIACTTHQAAAAVLFTLIDCGLQVPADFRVSRYNPDDPYTTFIIRRELSAQQHNLVDALRDVEGVTIANEDTS